MTRLHFTQQTPKVFHIMRFRGNDGYAYVSCICGVDDERSRLSFRNMMLTGKWDFVSQEVGIITEEDGTHHPGPTITMLYRKRPD